MWSRRYVGVHLTQSRLDRRLEQFNQSIASLDEERVSWYCVLGDQRFVFRSLVRHIDVEQHLQLDTERETHGWLIGDHPHKIGLELSTSAPFVEPPPPADVGEILFVAL